MIRRNATVGHDNDLSGRGSERRLSRPNCHVGQRRRPIGHRAAMVECFIFGCTLIRLQPRGGWQIMQRAVQWGIDVPVNCFRVTCNPNVPYAYFACSIRNRLEVWKSDRFENPKQIRSKAPVHLSSDEPRAATVAWAASIQGRHSSEALELQISSQQHISEGTGRDVGLIALRYMKSKDSASCWGWIKRKREVPLKFSKIRQVFDVDDRRLFNVPHPTKLVDGSRGGQAFMCELLRPKDNEVYPIEEQARMQLLSILLVATSLIKNKIPRNGRKYLKKTFS